MSSVPHKRKIGKSSQNGVAYWMAVCSDVAERRKQERRKRKGEDGKCKKKGKM